MSAVNCPECGRPVGAPEGESAQAHIIEHWGNVPMREHSKEAKERRKILQAIADKEDVNTVPSSGVDSGEE